MSTRRLTLLAAATLATALCAAVPYVSGASAAPAVPVLTAIRAAHHTGYDRLVFEFTGPLPAERSATWVTKVVADGSGATVPMVGSAFFQVRFSPASGHNSSGSVTYGATRRTYALPALMQVNAAGDFEATLSFGVSVSKKTSLKLTTLTNPSRVVIDIATPFSTVNVKDHFVDSRRFAVGTEPYTRAVVRPVIPPATAAGALQRLFAGPTQAEKAAGLRLVNSKATGFTALSISGGVARVRLVGGCSSGGSTLTVADQIMPTLKQFSTVTWVKIYAPDGSTERPTGNSDSIPECLEP